MMTATSALRALLIPIAALALTAALRRAPDERAVASLAPRAADTVPDPVLAKRIAAPGLMVMLRDPGEGDTASFYALTLDDSSRDLLDLGFFPGSALLDAGSRFELLGDSAPPGRVAVAARQAVDSALRRTADGCIEEVSVPVRRLASPVAPWTLALRAGAGRAVPASDWHAGTAADRRAALRLVEGLVIDSAERTMEMPGGDSVLTGTPFRLRTVRRLTIDGAELLLVDAWRDNQRAAGDSAPPASSDQFSEQRLLVAERVAGERASPFHVAWHHRDLSSVDEQSTLAPALLLRLGPGRLPTLYLTADYEDGGGGVFVSRTAPGRWTRIASWYGGC